MSYEITGIIKQIGGTATFGTKNFQKREVVLDVIDGKFTNSVKLEFTKDNCSKLDKFREGQEVTIGFNIRGSEYNSKYFVNLTAWKIDANGSQSQSHQSQPQRRQESPVLPARSAQVPVGGEGGNESYPF